MKQQAEGRIGLNPPLHPSHREDVLHHPHTHPRGRCLLGMRTVSRPNMAVSDSRPLLRLMSATCMRKEAWVKGRDE